jgi:uncharacterized membrane protein
MNFIPIPTWEAAHPLLVHFPIALLMVVPIFLVIGLVARDRGRPYFVASLVLMAMGTIGTFLAVASGEAGEDAAERVPAAEATLERHEELGELTRNVFAVLTVIYGAVLFGPLLLKKSPPRGLATVGTYAFLVAYAAGLALLANTGHLGGQLVHEHGVRAAVGAGAQEAPATAGRPETRRADYEEEDDH